MEIVDLVFQKPLFLLSFFGCRPRNVFGVVRVGPRNGQNGAGSDLARKVSICDRFSIEIESFGGGRPRRVFGLTG